MMPTDTFTRRLWLLGWMILFAISAVLFIQSYLWWHPTQNSASLTNRHLTPSLNNVFLAPELKASDVAVQYPNSRSKVTAPSPTTGDFPTNDFQFCVSNAVVVGHRQDGHATWTLWVCFNPSESADNVARDMKNCLLRLPYQQAPTSIKIGTSCFPSENAPNPPIPFRFLNLIQENISDRWSTVPGYVYYTSPS